MLVVDQSPITTLVRLTDTPADPTPVAIKTVVRALNGVKQLGYFQSVGYISSEAIRSSMPFFQQIDCSPLTKKLTSVWKPLKGTLLDWPLAVCNSATVKPSKDFAAWDTVFANGARENLMVHYDGDQQLLYISEQMLNELLLFHQAGSNSLG
jgi:hypothetical protein